MTTELLLTGPAPVRIIFAHGAGAPMDSSFMQTMAELLADRGIGVARFEFPYMREHRLSGKKRPPNRQQELLDCWRHVITSLQTPPEQLVLMGKSMGGRMASMIADEVGAAGLVCLGYPFHPPGKPERTRTEHLQQLKTPTLMIQGTRDALGNQQEVKGYSLAKGIDLMWLEDGDHDLKPRVRSGLTQIQHQRVAAEAIADFVRERVCID